MDNIAPPANDAANGDGASPDLLNLAIRAVTRKMSPIGAPGVPTVRDVLRHRLPFMRLFDRVLLRGVMLIARRQLVSISGIEHIASSEPFILALNHSTKREAVIVPAALFFHRGGRRIHFWSDWVYRLVPGVGLILRRAQTIVVITKPGRPRILNLLKPLFAPKLPAIDQARGHLNADRSIGVFPEGTVNRNRRRLLPGRRGTARLSLETGVAVVPVGIRFPTVPDGSGPIPEDSMMEIRIGAPLVPPRTVSRQPSPQEISAWHAEIMGAIAGLSGKTWEPAHHAVEMPEETAEAA